jgi:uncharacterized membrane protein YfcA
VTDIGAADVVVGAIAALVVGLSKTGIPGAALLATPLMASIFDGRLIAGATLPILFTADLFAVRWYRSSTRWDLLKPLAIWVAVGYAAGIWFFVSVGSGGRTLDVTIAITILVMVAVQAVRMSRRTAPVAPSTAAAGFYGTTGGFATFVSNTAGPILNTHLMRLGLGKAELIGTSAWFYFAVNLTKFPLYLALGWWSSGGPFFTRTSILFDLCMVPFVIVGVLAGRRLFNVLPTDVFMVAVLVLAGAAALKLLTG